MRVTNRSNAWRSSKSRNASKSRHPSSRKSSVSASARKSRHASASTWIVYGTYNCDPMAMFFGSGSEAREFMLECVHHPHVEEVNLDVHELRGIQCRELVWVSDDEL